MESADGCVKLRQWLIRPGADSKKAIIAELLNGVEVQLYSMHTMTWMLRMDTKPLIIAARVTQSKLEIRILKYHLSFLISAVQEHMF